MQAANEAQSAALRTLLRSLGQIVLQPNAITGACLLAAWLACDPRLACAALTGAVAANVSAVLAGHDPDDTQKGLHGFNGALAALAAFTFIADDATATAVAILAATASAWLLDPWSRWLRARGLGVYSSPCLIVTWAWLALVHPTARLANTLESGSLAHVMNGVLAGVAQTGFASRPLAGLLVLAGIAAASPRHALWAVTGAAIASLALALLGSNIVSFDTGLNGFNGALTALALADTGAGAALGGILLSVALQRLAAQYGWPTMTAPFVVATWTVHRLSRRGDVSGEPAWQNPVNSCRTKPEVTHTS